MRLPDEYRIDREARTIRTHEALIIAAHRLVLWPDIDTPREVELRSGPGLYIGGEREASVGLGRAHSAMTGSLRCRSIFGRDLEGP